MQVGASSYQLSASTKIEGNRCIGNNNCTFFKYEQGYKGIYIANQVYLGFLVTFLTFHTHDIVISNSDKSNKLMDS